MQNQYNAKRKGKIMCVFLDYWEKCTREQNIQFVLSGLREKGVKGVTIFHSNSILRISSARRACNPAEK